MIVESLHTSKDARFISLPVRAADLLAEKGSATYLAVYVYALRQYEKGNLSISNQAISQALKISVIDVVNAFLFYSSQGLIKIHNFTSVNDGDFDIEFLVPAESDCQAPLPFKPSYRASEISQNMKDNPRMSQMYKMASQILGKTLSSADIELLYSFHDYYGLPVEVILVLLEYYASKGKRSMKYIEKEAGKWTSAEINSVSKAKAYIKKREEFLSYAGRIRVLLGISDRKLTTRELAFINTWQNDFKMSCEKVKEAYEIAVNQTGKLSFAYMNKILESWGEQKDKEKPKKTGKKESRYDYQAFEKSAFEAINRPAEGE